MNRLVITGNLTRDPELRTTQSGKSVCTFTVAVNRRGQQKETDYFRVSAWDKLGENCNQFLAKGRKVAVVGSVSVHTYTTQNGETRADLAVVAQEVEFLTPKAEERAPEAPTFENGYTEVEDDDLPFY